MNSIFFIVMGIFKLCVSYWVSCGSLCFFKELIHFIQVFKFMCVELFAVFPYCLSDIWNNGLLFHSWYWKLPVCVFSPFFFAISLSILLILSKNELLVRFLCFKFHWFFFALYCFLPSALVYFAFLFPDCWSGNLDYWLTFPLC